MKTEDIKIALELAGRISELLKKFPKSAYGETTVTWEEDENEECYWLNFSINHGTAKYEDRVVWWPDNNPETMLNNVDKIISNAITLFNRR